MPRPILAFAMILAVVLTFLQPAYAQPDPYRLGYGDALTVSLIGQPALSVENQAIRPDGRISLPLVQELHIQGKTVPEVTAAISKAYGPFLANPQVVVSVVKFRPTRITLFGQVARPGTFDFEAPPTLIDALATAGGLTDRASRTTIKVFAPGAGGFVTYDMDRLLSGAVEVPRLQEGTTIEVAEVWGPDWYRVIPVVAGILTTGAWAIEMIR